MPKRSAESDRDGDAKRIRESNVKTFDITLYERHNDYGLEPSSVLPKLAELGSNWVAQRELCPSTGTPHFQIRLKTWKAMRPSAFVKLARDVGMVAHIRPTSTKASKTFNYVMKADSRDPDYPEPFSDKTYEPPREPLSHVQAFESFTKYAWQEKVIEMSQVYDDRCVDVIVDPVGNQGKSALQAWLDFHNLGMNVPSFTEQTDMIPFVMSFPPSKAYLINMPKSQKKSRLGGFYASVETLKDGNLFDTRYKGRRLQIEKPRVFVFTNQVPDVSLLSQDRWRIWGINPSTKDLVDLTAKYVTPPEEVDATAAWDRLCNPTPSAK